MPKKPKKKQYIRVNDVAYSTDTITRYSDPRNMANKTFYFLSSAADAYSLMQDGGSAPSQLVLNTGWIVGTVAPTKYCLMDTGTERDSALQSGTVEPANPPNSIIGDCFRSSGTYNGTFAAGTWGIGFGVIGITRSTSTTDGILRLRLWKGISADGSDAILVTGTILTSQYTNLSNSVFQNISGSVSLSPLTLSNEYLFLQVAHQLDGAGNNANADVHLARGADSFLFTPNFTVTEPTTQVNISDTAHGTDQASEGVFLSQSDQGTGTEALSLRASLSQSDTGHGTDNIVLIKLISIQDAGFGSDNINVNTLISLNDIGQGSDSLSVSASISVQDTANAVYSGIGAEFPITPILDNFNRGDGPLGDNWNGPVENNGVFRILNNKITTDEIGNDASGFWIADFNAPLEAYIDSAIANNITTEVYFCIQSIYPSPVNFYIVGIYIASIAGTVDYYILKRVNGAGTNLKSNTISTPPESINGIGVRLLEDGTILFFWKLDQTWELLDQTQDSSFSFGDSGIYLDPLGEADNFGGGNLSYMDIFTVYEDIFPVSDIANIGSWENELGGSILYTSIDEPGLPNDADYVWTVDAQAGNYFEVKLGTPDYLFDDGNTIIQWRGFNLNLGVNTTIRVDLMENSIVRASTEQILSDTPTTYVYTLTQAEADSIVEISALRLRFTVTGIS